MNSRYVACLLLTLLLTANVASGIEFPDPQAEANAVIEPPPARPGHRGFIRAARQQAPIPVAPPVAPPVALPADAQKLTKAFEQEAAEIRAKAKAEIAARQQKLIEELTKLQDVYTKPGTLDEAVAIRNRIRQLKTGVQGAGVQGEGIIAQPDPGMLTQFRGQVGRVILFRVTGKANGIVWGTGIYTDDSALATAAVHAGILQDGVQGVVAVTILPGQVGYAASQNNGVTSHDWQDWSGSYMVASP